MKTSNLRLMIVDDYALFRAGLRRLLELEDDLVVVGEAEDGRQALERASALQPDVILMDVYLPFLNGLQVTHRLADLKCGAAVIILTAGETDELVLPALRAGASALLPKNADADLLVRAIREVAKGNCVVGTTILPKCQINRWMHDYQTRTGLAGDDHYEEPTPREIELLHHIADGKSNKEIAILMGITRQTVKNHLNTIFRKLGAVDRTQAVVLAWRRGWIRL